MRPEIDRLLGSCDRRQRGGARDYAIMLLLARLGLRSIEVARMQLEDLDWRAGELEVDGKAHRRDRLPLPAMSARRWPGTSRFAAAGAGAGTCS